MEPRSRYSNVSRRVWNDDGFRALSAPAPNAQTLWFRLLTGPELTNVPGLIPCWEAGLAQALRWSLEGFREAFREVSAQGMAEADWEAGLVWVPKAILHNRPASPNVIISWLPTWDLAPECELKLKAYQELKAFTDGLSEGFRKAFRKACRSPSLKAMANQEQEQEQDQEIPLSSDLSSPSQSLSQDRHSATTLRRSPMGDGAFGMAGKAWCEGVESVHGGDMIVMGAELERLNQAIRQGSAKTGENPVDWARRTGIAFARDGGKMSVFRFLEFLGGGGGTKKAQPGAGKAPPAPPGVEATPEEEAAAMAAIRGILSGAGRLPEKKAAS
jgi:hypothetical protein